VTGKFPLAPPLRETGYVVPSTLPESARLRVLDLATAALGALRVRHGATHIEIKLTPAGPRIIEVNGRVGGYVADLIRRATGYDLIRAAITAALGRPCAPPATAASRCAFQYFVTPPMDAVGLNDLGGLETLAQRRGLTVEPVASVGDRLDWRRGTLTYVAILHGSGQDHEDVLRQVDDIDRTLHIIYT
jgi:biotin carboxylase